MAERTALLDGPQRQGVVQTVLDNNPGMEPGMAERIVDEATKFVLTAAEFPQAALTPSRVVDEGWHGLILHTRLYKALCARRGGYVEHTPGYDPENYDPAILTRTQAMMREAGFTPDEELWTAPDKPLVTVAAQCQHGKDDGPIIVQPKPKPNGG
ncbi:glycine-rich domain-containing protein [Streptomyces antimycoticus]|uniref:glycine-rich domain-containing protein n=1 Tax=Streptomyces antimycoticus TaxID=68175 RepID=UPI0037D556F3